MRNIFKLKTSSKESKLGKPLSEKDTKTNKQKSKTSKKEAAAQSKNFYGNDDDLGYC
ncbi:MAG: hypothetical protein IPM48_12250 [Saprospiraceae bacterium]|nr:hypothetical protein [Saprospiraceae bacterium]